MCFGVLAWVVMGLCVYVCILFISITYKTLQHHRNHNITHTHTNKTKKSITTPLPPPAGINIEVVDQGVNGVVISSLVRNGAVHKDARLHAGDFILSVNNESMRNITNSQARAILRRTQLVSTDVR